MYNIKQSSRAQYRPLWNSDKNVGEELCNLYLYGRIYESFSCFLCCIYSNQTATIAFLSVLRCNTPWGSRGLLTDSLIHSVTINQLILLFT